MQCKAIVFEGKQQAALITEDMPVIEPGQVLVQAICSLVSTGTEGRCFARAFGEDSPMADWVKYPFHTGYSWVGKIIEIGPEVGDWQIGDRVAARRGHASHHVIDHTELIHVPDGVTDQQAAWFALAKIAGVATRAAAYQFGEMVAIIGAGPIGQMATRWAAASGLQHVVVIDPVAKRLKMALQGGATAVIDKPVAQANDVFEQQFGRLPDIVIDSTGNAQVFVEAQQLPRQFGRVILLGSAGDPTQQHITPLMMRNGLHMIGVHDIHNDEMWNNTTYAQFYFQLVQRGRFNMDHLIWHKFRPEECEQVYPFITEHRAQTMGILFDWE